MDDDDDEQVMNAFNDCDVDDEKLCDDIWTDVKAVETFSVWITVRWFDENF